MADLRSKVHDFWDRGLLSIALDPAFPTRSAIYALYAHDAPPGGTAPTYGDACADPTGAGCKITGRLSQIGIDGTETVLISDWCQQYPSHSTGSIAFGPDGKLYVSGGDGASFNWSTSARAGAIPRPAPDRRATPSPRTPTPTRGGSSPTACATRSGSRSGPLYSSAGAVTPPHYAYRHSDHVIPSESRPIGGSSIAGLSFAFYGRGPYPAEYDGALFFADHTRRCVWAMMGGATTTPSPSNIKGFVGGAASPAELQMGPDGNLHYVDLGGGTIRRIEYTAGVNQPPTAVARASPTSGDVGVTVAFAGSGSSDPNGDALGYAWDLDGDGAFDDSTAVRPTWTYAAAGEFRVQLRVSDGKGATATDALTIGVGRPRVTIAAPTAATPPWSVGSTVSFSGSAVDNRGAAIPATGLSWQLTLKHGAPGDSHDHPLQAFPGVASGSFTAPDHAHPSFLELTLTAKDGTGLTGTAKVDLQPRTTRIDLRSEPTGLQLTINGSNVRTPASRTVIVGSVNSISAPTPQQLKGKQRFRRRLRSGQVVATTPTLPALTASATAEVLTAQFSK